MRTVMKWSWFLCLMLAAFAYMCAGLSEPADGGKTESKIEAQPASRGGLPNLMRGDWASLMQTTSAIDRAHAEMLEQSGLEEAPVADWLTICRRMSLALVGSGMSLEEIRVLEQLPEEDRESTHLSRLLDDPRFHDYWAERWTRFLVGADEGPFAVYRRRRFRHWLADQISANLPYDQFVSKLVTAEGLWTDRPEVNFLTVTFDTNDGSPDPVRLAARTSRAFLGLRIDCLQCHNDFLGNVNLGDVNDLREGLQTDFHQLASFYTAAKMNGLQGIRAGDTDYEYQYLDTDETVPVEPAVPYGESFLPAEGDSRERLAGWITHRENRQFARAAVARFWALIFGRAPAEAVDNLPLDEPLPEMLQPIIDDFQEHRDIRRTISAIVQSRPFRLDSRADFQITPEHESIYAAFPLTRLRGEQVAGSIVQASKIKAIDRDSSFVVQLIRFGSINDFLQRYGDLGENEFSKDGITIPQRLLMLNGEMLRESSGANPVLSATSHINMFAKDDRQAVESVFLCLLNRYPAANEREHYVRRLAESDDRVSVIEDFFWTLANSTEFAWNH
ncbi:MAG: DUF1549 domain-containing protein [Planctomycetota bacterium]